MLTTLSQVHRSSIKKSSTKRAKRKSEKNMPVNEGDEDVLEDLVLSDAEN